MRVPESVKQVLKVFSGKQEQEQPVQPKERDDVHYTPPGQWPSRGPKPSKVGVLLYYISLAFCVVGILFMAKCSYAKREDRPDILMIGSMMVLVGFIFLGFSNYIYNREQRRLIFYLKGKIAELMEENKGKGPRSLDS